MMKNNFFTPTLLLPEVYFPHVNEKGYLAKKIEDVAEEAFYGGVEIASIHDASDRKRVKEASTHAGLTVVQWMTSLITENELDLSAVDTTVRLNAVEKIKRNLYLATECGATHVALITGPDPGVKLRKEANERLYESLCKICAVTSDYGINLLVEPLDRNVHKKRFLGPTDESIELISRVKDNHRNIGLAFDTAHAALNGENIQEAVDLSGSHISQLHLSNAVLDQSNPLFGDNHMPIGDPGFLNFESVMELFRRAKEAGILSEKVLRVSVEERTPIENDPEVTEMKGKVFLQKVLETLESE